jgi:REP element-mobilizing transposase RayT
MPNTYTQIHIHFVFAVKNRLALIDESIRNRVEKYVTGIVQNFGHKLLAVYCMPDHAHLFIGFRPDQSISDLMREIKSKSSEFMNKEKLTKEKFNWQEGYGAFSYSHSHVENVIDYVLIQPEHHKKKTFKEEYLEFLKKFEIPYEEKYLFNWIEMGSTPTEPRVIT